MFHRVLITDGGPHPPERWAEMTCDDLLPVAEIPERFQQDATTLHDKLLDLLTEYHAATQTDERQRLEANGAAQLDSPLQGRSQADFETLFKRMQEAAAGTAWDELMRENAPAMRIPMLRILNNYTMQIRHVERLWHTDRHPELEAGQRYRQRMPSQIEKETA